MRLGPGPVFAWHATRLARRPGTYWLRVAIPLILVVTLLVAWGGEIPEGEFVPIADWTALAFGLFNRMLFWQLAFILLIAPALTAGAFGADKARGTLGLLLVTDLSGSEVAAGTIMAQMLPVLAPVAAGAPVLALVALLGGIAPEMFVLGYAATFGAVLTTCAFSSLCALWCRRTRDAVLFAYLILMTWMLTNFIWDSICSFWPGIPAAPWGINPLAAVGEIVGPFAEVAALAQLAVGVAGMMFVSLIASWRLRPVVLRQTFHAAGGRRLGLAARLRRRIAPEPWANLVFWRQWTRHGGALGNRWATRAYLALSGACAAIGVANIWRGGMFSGIAALVSGAFSLSLGLLLLSASAAATLAEDRARGLLDALLVTPLSSESIARGYWLGTAAAFPWIALPGLVSAIALGWSRPELGWMIAAFLLVVGLHMAFTISVALHWALQSERIGRAVAGSVGVFLALCIAVPLAAYLCEMPFGRDNSGRETLALSLGSPFVGALTAYSVPDMQWSEPKEYVVWLGGLAWVGLLLAISGWLAVALPRRLESRLGRMPDGPAVASPRTEGGA